jgi:hypothetical protein
MKQKKNAILLACQIVYEYENWTVEHISDMLNTYEPPSVAPCDGNELMDLCYKIMKYKKEGKSFEETKKIMLNKK